MFGEGHDGVFEAASAVFVAFEQVKAGAAGREQHGVAGGRELAASCHGLVKRMCVAYLGDFAFEEVDNETHPHIYNQGLVCIGDKTVIPGDVKIGKNVVVSGITTKEDYPDNILVSGKSLIKAGDKA